MLSNAIRLDKRAAYVVDCAAVQCSIRGTVVVVVVVRISIARFIFARLVLRFSHIPELDEARKMDVNFLPSNTKHNLR